MRLLSCLCLLLPAALRAEFATVWTLGVHDGTPNGFGSVWGIFPSPGSASVLDDDYYFAGDYSDPVGVVAAAEPVNQADNALASGDNSASQRYHFMLSAGQAAGAARVRFILHHCWGGTPADRGYGTHEFTVKLNGAVIGTRTASTYGALVVEADATPNTGANTIEVIRSGGSADGWVHIDALAFEIDPTATLDADSDGLPRWWEETHGLSDTNPADAALDLDGDDLTHLQEFARGTNPRLADTDGDGLSDAVETNTGVYAGISELGTNPLLADTDGDTLSDGDEWLTHHTSPLLADSDADGAPDAWELRTGHDAMSAASTPPVFPDAVAVNFVSDVNPHNALPWLAPAGLSPQLHWNNTMPLTSWNTTSGNTMHIESPQQGVLVNSAGAPTTMTLAWTSPNHVWINGNTGAPDRMIMDAYLVVSDSTPASVTIGGIPFAGYDVILYAGGSYDGAVGYARLNDLPATDRWFITGSRPPETRFTEPHGSTPAKPWRGNAIRWRNVTGATASVKLFPHDNHELGIHGIQIVDSATDSDGDGMTDSWELTHRLRPDLNDAALDPDGDGLSNSGEYARGTDPHNPDTDGDGLTDNVERNTGVFFSHLNTGSNPLIADTDGDGLSDGEELARLPSPTNPLLADTDSDGMDDAEEIRLGRDPLFAESAGAFLPQVTTSPRTFLWQVENVQIIRDHTRGHHSGLQWGDDTLLRLTLRNSAFPNQDAFWVALRVVSGRITRYFYSNYESAFSHPDNNSWDNWESDWNEPPTDLAPALGFSGHGSVDMSDRLRFRIEGSSPGSRTNWTFTFSIFNQDTNTTVASTTFASCALALSVHNNSATWQDQSGAPGIYSLYQNDGVRVFIHSARLDTTTAFAAWKDSDNDGMTDAWENLHGFDKNNPADASLDADNDGLTNLQEFLAGTNPHNSDSDNDGAPDGVEVAAGSDPRLGSSLPPWYHGPPAGVSGADLNGNGIPDAWELWLSRFDLAALDDDDGDGMSNADEAAAGTDPFDPYSRLWVDTTRAGSDLVVAWPLLALKHHRLWQNDSLSPATWTPAPGVPLAFGNEYRQTVAGALTGAQPRFFKATVADLDTDGDGVSDWAEVSVLGSDRLAADSARAPAPVDSNDDGQPDTALSGDHATLLEKLHGASPAGGFPGGAGGGISRSQAARFLTQASFGPTLEDIEQVQSLGFEGWINAQRAASPTLHSDYIRSIWQDMMTQRANPNYVRSEVVAGEDRDPFLFGGNMKTAFARAAIQGPDQLRQRVAFALSQILVTSRRDANLENRCLGMADYYDIFVRHAFGSYHDILMEVTLHPVMGRYLSHVGNQKARPEINQYPDENYAREVMQLFTIGLWRLNPDGTRQLDSQGQPIPTYSNAEITQLARVLTGLWFGGHYWGGGGWTETDYATPMTMHADRHDFGKKTLLDGFVIPARTPTHAEAMRDIQDAIRHLFEHPNTAPFVSRQLIQFLVTDNPTPAYVARVATVFTSDDYGQRGNLFSVVRAILLDPEARGPSRPADYGRLKEPVIRAIALGRAFGMKQVPDLLWWDWNDFYNDSRQEPGYSPSVFNFYRPDYRAPGLLTQQGKAGPVFQITDSYSSISFPNRLWQMVMEGFSYWEEYRFPIDLSRERSLAAQPERLVDHLNTLFCAGEMTRGTRALILQAVNAIPAAETAARARVAAYLALVCPEGAVMR
ncbi:MAG TPA: DUF1800 family protein [Prosthecobacter sp.]|nr:DUF1800 family protein [Prosthecobacter sp.]